MIRRLRRRDVAGVLDLVRKLPEWFDERACYVAIPVDIKHHDGFVYQNGRQIAGFATYYVADGRLNIGWLAVGKSFHRNGIGTELINHLSLTARGFGINEIASWMVGDSVTYEPYVATRRFYEANGFTIYQRNETDDVDCRETYLISKDVRESNE